MDDLSIPSFLLMTAAERQQYWASYKPTKIAAEPAKDFSEQIKKHKLRKLRAEERRLSDLIDDIGCRDQAARRRLYEAIKVVERDIASAERGLQA